MIQTHSIFYFREFEQKFGRIEKSEKENIKYVYYTYKSLSKSFIQYVPVILIRDILYLIGSLDRHPTMNSCGVYNFQFFLLTPTTNVCITCYVLLLENSQNIWVQVL